MITFAEYLAEGTEGKNLHLEHLEDEVLNNGVNGTRAAINFLQSLRDMLAGNTKSSVNVTVKWDGAPAVFAGINPENGKFFVGTKGVFNKNQKSTIQMQTLMQIIHRQDSIPNSKLHSSIYQS